METFANHPPSITEVRADREDDGRLWTPRDALISVLRDIDEGKINIGTLAVVFNRVEPNGAHSDTKYAISYRSVPELLGILSRAQHLINNA